MRKLIQQGLARLGLAPLISAASNEVEKVVAPQVIRGGDAAPALAMQPVDWTDDQPAPLRSVVQLKVDGVRALYIDGRIVTREGAPLACADHCASGLKRLERHLGEPFFFDAEYSEEDGFNATLAAHRRGKGEGVLWLFDAVPIREWRVDRASQPIEQRLERLAKALPHSESMFVGMLDYWIMGPAEARQKAADLWALGYEGIVAKRARSLYARRRSDAWLRLKREVTLDCTVLALTATPAGRRSVVVRDPDGRQIKVPVDDQIGFMPGDMVEISLQPATGGGYRGARFVRSRPDRETAA